MIPIRAAAIAFAVFFTILAAPSGGLAGDPAPEAASPGTDAPDGPARAQRHMVAAANPHAARAGREILRAGGSAIDAAVAMQMVLNLVEPQSSGIGGGGFLLHFDAAKGATVAYDGRETAPAAARPGMFLKADGTPMDFFDAVVGGLAVGTPGVVAMLAAAHEDHGRLAWKRLFQPAIALAENGFAISPRLHALVSADRYLTRYEPARSYFYTESGAAKPVGTVLRNPDLADTLRRIAEGGPAAFYEGDIARDIVAAVREVPDNPGRLSLADLKSYEAKRRAPVCGHYRVYRVCGMPPPTSGGVTVLQILGILSNFEMAKLEPVSADSAHLLAEAGRLAFADRNRFLADPDYVEMPVARLTSPDYLGDRSRQIRMDRSMGGAEPGLSFDHLDMPEQPDPPSTTHLVAVDGDGNVVSFTSSVENAFGSRVMVRGFLLNNQLTDFSFRPEIDGRPVANRAAPGKRPRSSMSPMIVFDESDAFELAVGSPGGSRIIGYVAQALVAMLDWGLDPQAAAAMPHALSRNGPTELEAGTGFEELAPALKERGHDLRIDSMVSGVHAIRRVADGYLGGADPRREGVALGD
ncbi:MAG: gamma-glutamyltransferase [Rhodovibrionaceae bacterium]|nr:gamma-glutamyltransferase [Rhodovibrionaceae bacterium]